MPARSKKLGPVPLNVADSAAVAAAKPYVQRFIEDEELRNNFRAAIDSSRSAYDRLTNGKAAHKALLEDKKLQGDLRDAVVSLRDATVALNEPPKKKRRLGRRLLIVVVAAGLALALSETLRSKVLDALFGAEEEFEYTPPPPPASSQPTAPVSAA